VQFRRLFGNGVNVGTEKRPAFQFYPKDFLTDERVRLMSHTERGIYITLLCLCWLEGSLPAETKNLAKLVELPHPRFERIWSGVLQGCFLVRTDGRLSHKRLEVERLKQETFARRQSDKSKARWDRPGNAAALPSVALPVECSPISDLRSSSSEKKEQEREPRTWKAAGVMAGMLPRDHMQHEVCGRVCLLRSQFVEFVRLFGGDEATATTAVRDWSKQILEEWDKPPKLMQPIGGGKFAFWQARWDEWHPVVRPATKRSDEPDWAAIGAAGPSKRGV
jgi:uncharacterized protein YdaU (DUF1376 family)